MNIKNELYYKMEDIKRAFWSIQFDIIMFGLAASAFGFIVGVFYSNFF